LESIGKSKGSSITKINFQKKEKNEELTICNFKINSKATELPEVQFAQTQTDIWYKPEASEKDEQLYGRHRDNFNVFKRHAAWYRQSRSNK
jgi:hypothetical protein